MARRGSSQKSGMLRLSLQLTLLVISFFLIFIGKIDLYTVRATKTTISEIVAPLYDVVAAPVCKGRSWYMRCLYPYFNIF